MKRLILIACLFGFACGGDDGPDSWDVVRSVCPDEMICECNCMKYTKIGSSEPPRYECAPCE